MRTRGIAALVLCGLATVLSGCSDGAVTFTAEPSAPPAFEVSSPVDGSSVSTAQIVVSGTGPSGERVVRDISLASDDEATIDGGGTWSMPVELDDGSNTLKFRLGDDKDTTINLTVTYAPAASSPPATTPGAPTPNPAVVDALGMFLIENFGSPGYETPWWRHIKAWTVEGDVVVITTDLTAHDADASNICSAATGFAFFEDGSEVREGAVEIRAEDGSVIWTRSGTSDPC